MADLEIIAGKLYINNEEVVLKSDTISRTQIVDFGTVAKDTRPVKPNPFFDGVNDTDIAVACTARAEIFANGMWSEAGWLFHSGTIAGRGTKAYSNVEGIVVQTGGEYVVNNKASSSGHGFPIDVGNVTSAPCRVIVTYHGDLILPSSAIVKPEYIDSRSLATAWVNFNGVDGSISDSFNVSSISVNGTGNYGINFETPMDNSNYSATASCDLIVEHIIRIESQQTTRFDFRTTQPGVGNFNANTVSIIVIGGKNV